MKIEIKKIKVNLPDKIFGIETSLLTMFLAPLFVVIIFLMTLVGIIIPKINQIIDTNTEIQKVSGQIKLTNEKRVYLSSIDQEQLQQDASYLNSAILKEKKSYLLVGVIKKIADEYSFVIKSFSVSPGEMKGESSEKDGNKNDKNSAVELPISVVLSGPKANSLNLIKGIENSLPLLFIDVFNTETTKETSTLDLKMHAYYVPEKTDLISGNLTLNDLKPTDQEKTLLKEISNYRRVEISSQSQGEKSFVKTERGNPFSL